MEMFRSSFPLSFLFFVPILIIISPAPAAAAQEFAVFRMQHYDLQGSNYGICKHLCILFLSFSVEYPLKNLPKNRTEAFIMITDEGRCLHLPHPLGG